METSIIEDELLALESIYNEELIIRIGQEKFPITASILLHPATAEDVNSRYVFVNVDFVVSDKYPQVGPEIVIKSSRGLSDLILNEMKKKMDSVVEFHLGEMMLFDLIETVKDCLTNNNLPWMPCSICLCNFHKCDIFMKTECYHYFHCFCMFNYAQHQLNNAEDSLSTDKPSFMCPDCRKSINIDVKSLENSPEPFNEEEDVAVDLSLFKETRKKQAKIFERQRLKGGIIDIEEEKNKYLVSNIEKAFALSSIEASKSEEKASSSKVAEPQSKPPAKPNKKYNTRNYKYKNYEKRNSVKDNNPDNFDEDHKHLRSHCKRHNNSNVYPRNSNWRQHDFKRREYYHKNEKHMTKFTGDKSKFWDNRTKLNNLPEKSSKSDSSKT